MFQTENIRTTGRKRTDRVHAVIPAYRGGRLVPDNTAELPLPLHALHHYLVAEGFPPGNNDRDVNVWAFNQIFRRAPKEDKDRIIDLLTLHRSTGGAK